ncbi:cell division protein ZapB [Vibrio sp. Of7-15]|uniref:cell division protein ZapB n=1 Tax=Vibrio sp. Of7-15 TaxID=2724879 RepID=UPI001EF19BFA|nr:cell division protein ZapB [Vibrio sp. Of7-15]MCG7496890.1 cell division protein ZapB [Vibrio sp. Of7-15]
MSLEVLEKLEAKVQMAVDTISLLQMEVEELKEQNEQLSAESAELKSSRTDLEEQNQQLRTDHEAWQARVRNLLGKMDDVE